MFRSLRRYQPDQVRWVGIRLSARTGTPTVWFKIPPRDGRDKHSPRLRGAERTETRFAPPNTPAMGLYLDSGFKPGRYEETNNAPGGAFVAAITDVGGARRQSPRRSSARLGRSPQEMTASIVSTSLLIDGETRRSVQGYTRIGRLHHHREAFSVDTSCTERIIYGTQILLRNLNSSR